MPRLHTVLYIVASFFFLTAAVAADNLHIDAALGRNPGQPGGINGRTRRIVHDDGAGHQVLNRGERSDTCFHRSRPVAGCDA